MKASRELDALTAEKVMGWTILDWDGSGPLQGFPPCEAYDLKQGERRPPASRPTSIPLYSTEPEIAWQIVDRIQEMGEKLFEAFLDNAPDSFEAQKVIRGAPVRYWGEGASPAEICIAALRAVGWKE